MELDELGYLLYSYGLEVRMEMNHFVIREVCVQRADIGWGWGGRAYFLDLGYQILGHFMLCDGIETIKEYLRDYRIDRIK